MNIKVRLKNKAFWLGFIPTLVALVYCILGLFGVVPTISENTVVKALTVLISLLANLGVLVDPTTEGIKDSVRAMTYDSPFKRRKDNESN